MFFFFRKSLKLEPQPKNQNHTNNLNASNSAMTSAASNSFCSIEGGIASLNVSPAKSSSMRLNAGQSSKFSLGHRKTQSLGSK